MLRVDESANLAVLLTLSSESIRVKIAFGGLLMLLNSCKLQLLKTVKQGDRARSSFYYSLLYVYVRMMHLCQQECLGYVSSVVVFWKSLLSFHPEF